ncbi:MAG: DUF4235 domain-containing protein [Galactobacter sp.]|uniref:DUF4235 domain-containing protein n=1 Tax=Galactobacter sp. TaxID=2676125 RepID=UPI0025C3F1FC|nr:DUF4235 domain-containing protein [Galactobacter sp.]
MKPLIKILSSVAAIVGGIVGGKMLTKTWTQVTGEDAPTKKNKEAQAEQSVTRVAVFTAASAALAVVIKLGTQRAGERIIARGKQNPEEV